MAYICTNGFNKECNGCMKCLGNEIEDSLQFGWCDCCGNRVDLDELYNINEGFFCEDCLEDLEKK